MKITLLNSLLCCAAAAPGFGGDALALIQSWTGGAQEDARPVNRRAPDDDRAKIRSHMFKNGGGVIVSHGFHLAGRGPKVFCTVVFRDETDLIVETSVALRQCDGFAIVSNHTTTFNETHKHLKVHGGINGTMDAEPDPRWGNPKNTYIFKQLWDFLAQERDIKQYDWILKIDPDTFLRPEKLPLLFKRHPEYKSSTPMIISHRPNSKASLGDDFKCCEYYDEHSFDMWKRSGIRGGFCMMSRAFFSIYRKHGCKVSHEFEPAEDIWWDRCMETRPYRKSFVAGPQRQCIDTILDAHMYHPVGYNLTGERRAAITPYMVQNIADGEELFHEQGFCVSPDIIAIHPVKSPAAHRLLREQLAGLNSTLSDGTAFHQEYPDAAELLFPVGGWMILPEDAATGSK